MGGAWPLWLEGVKPGEHGGASSIRSFFFWGGGRFDDAFYFSFGVFCYFVTFFAVDIISTVALHLVGKLLYHSVVASATPKMLRGASSIPPIIAGRRFFIIHTAVH